MYIHGVILNKPRGRQHGDINPDPLDTAQLQHAIIWKPYALVPFFLLQREETVALAKMCIRGREGRVSGNTRVWYYFHNVEEMRNRDEKKMI